MKRARSPSPTRKQSPSLSSSGSISTPDGGSLRSSCESVGEMSDSGSEYLDPEDAVARNRALARARRNSDSYIDSAEEDEQNPLMPEGYMSAEAYNDDRTKTIRGLDTWGHMVWVKPVGGGIAIYFKPEFVEDTKWELPTKQREESKNEGDRGFTWHHTIEMDRGRCFMQLVPTDAHAGIPHKGAVSQIGK